MPLSPIDDLLNAVGITNDQLMQNSDVIRNLQASQKAEQEKQLAAQQEATEKGKIVLAAEKTAELVAQDKTLDQATKLGTNLDSSTEIMSMLSEKWRDSAVNSVKAYERVEKNVNARFLDDPIEFVKARLDLQSSVQDAQAADAKQARIEKNLQFAQQQTQSMAVTQTALAKTKSAETVQATLDQASAVLAANTSRQKIENAGVNIRGIQDLNQLSLQQLNLASTKYSALGQERNEKRQEEQMNMQRAQFAQSQKAFAMQVEERQERIAEKKANAQEMDEFANIVRKGAASLGYKDVSAFPTNKIIQLMNNKATHFQDFLQAGMKTEVAGEPVVSEDPGQAARIIMQTGAPLRPEQKDVKQFLVDSWSESASPEVALKGGYDASKPDALTKATGILAARKAREQMGDIKTGDRSNIYSAPPLNSVLGIPAIKNSAFYQKTLAPQVAAGGLTELNPDQLVAFAVTGIKNNTLSYNDAAAGLQGIFNAIPALNNVTKNYASFGLPKQVGFNARVEMGRGNMRKYDLTQQQNVNALLNSRLNKLNEVSKSIFDTRPFGLN